MWIGVKAGVGSALETGMGMGLALESGFGVLVKFWVAKLQALSYHWALCSPGAIFPGVARRAPGPRRSRGPRRPSSSILSLVSLKEMGLGMTLSGRGSSLQRETLRWAAPCHPLSQPLGQAQRGGLCDWASCHLLGTARPNRSPYFGVRGPTGPFTCQGMCQLFST